MSFDASTEGVQAAVSEATTAATQSALSGAAASGSAATINSATLNSMSALKAQYPQLYNVIVQSIALQICSDSEDQNDDLIATIQQGEMDDDD